MSQNPGPWGPNGPQNQPQGDPARGGQQGGYPPQGAQPAYSPQSPQQGYPQQGYPQQPAQQGYPQNYPGQGHPGPAYAGQGGQQGQGYAGPGYSGYPQQGFAQQSGYAGQSGGYQAQPGYGQQPPPGSYPTGGRPPTRKSPGLIIGIVVAAVVLLVAVGGIFIALSGGSNDEPVSTITPTAPPSEPTTQPSEPSTAPSQPGQPSTSPKPSGDVIDLGNGIVLRPASGWQVQDQAAGVASLTNGQAVFYGRQLSVDKSTNASQFCDAFNRAALKSAGNAKFGEPQARDVGSAKLSAATCGATYTETSGDKSLQVFVSSLVSVRKSDGLTVVGTLLFVKSTDDQTKTDAGQMVSSMLTSQVS
ncbi:MAG TPA: hypothetical protein VFP34_15210 [Microlunatus sp.]|nr:hypothetical protein [Microlunatus sp.]